MSAVLHLVVTGLLCLGTIPLLARADWPARAPATAILLWQSVMLTLFLCVVGTFLAWGLDPYPGNLAEGFSLAVSNLLDGRLTRELEASHLIALSLGVAGMVLVAVVALVRCHALGSVRRRHRRLIALVSRGDPAIPGAAVLQHSAPVAYCVPGFRPHIVISTGALDLLDGQQIRAVLAHEHAHARARHDLVLLPFTLLERLLPRCDLLTQATAAVAALIEMCADDEAQQQAPPQSVAAALVRMSTHSNGPTGTLNINDRSTTTRVKRLLAPQHRLPTWIRFLVVTVGTTLISTPLSFLVFPL